MNPNHLGVISWFTKELDMENKEIPDSRPNKIISAKQIHLQCVTNLVIRLIYYMTLYFPTFVRMEFLDIFHAC